MTDNTGMKRENLKVILKDFDDAQLEFETLRGRIKALFATQEMQQTINISYRLKQNDTLWMSAKFAGVFEVAKLMMSQESINFYERLDNNYFSGDFKLVSDFLGIDLTYTEIENLILAKNIKSFDIDRTDYEVTGNEFMITTTYENGIIQVVKIEKSIMKVIEQVLYLKDQQLKITYNSYQTINNKYFPEVLSIYANKKDEQVNLVLSYKSIKLNDKLRFPFKIPSNFTPLKLD